MASQQREGLFKRLEAPATVASAVVAIGLLLARTVPRVRHALSDWGVPLDVIWPLALAAFALLLLVLYFRVRRERSPVEQPPPTPPTRDARTHFKGETLRLADLADASGHIVECVFEGCTLLGPAVVCLENHTLMEHNQFQHPGKPPESLFLLTPSAHPVGAIGLNRCIVRRCILKEIGITGPQEALDIVRKGFIDPPKSQARQQAPDTEGSPPE